MKIIKILFFVLVFASYDLNYLYVKSVEIGVMSNAKDRLELNMQMEMEKAKKNRLRNRHKVHSQYKLDSENTPVDSNSNSKENTINSNSVDNKDVNTSTNSNSNSSSNSNASESSSQKELPDLPVYYNGWVKYLRFRSGGSNSSKPKQFFKNDLYAVQMKNGITQNQIKEKDNNGYIYIPSEIHFYVILYKNSLNIFSSRDDALQRTVDILNIDYIKPIPEGNNYLGGIRDFGNFSEGSCFKVLTKYPIEPFVMSQTNIEPKNGLERKWVFCFDNPKEKNELMNLLIKLKLKKQHALGVYIELDDKGEVKDNSQSTVSTINKQYKQSDNPNDGRWVILQDWSQCTLKCGGGLQYQQLMCIPPNQGGKPCEGSAIRTKPCNTQPCPTAKILQNSSTSILNNENNNQQLLPPIIKAMPISKRPNRYDKCVIKEGDAMMVKQDSSKQNFQVFPRIPVRIILNERTFSIFQDDNYSNLISSFIIKETEFARVVDDPRCFVLKTVSGIKAQICQLDSSGTVNWIEEWDYDYNLFKKQCYKNRSKSNTELKIAEENKIKEEFKEKVDHIKVDIVTKVKQEVVNKVKQQDEVKLQSRVDQAKQKSLAAMQKEIKLENLLEAEEQIKEKQETQEMQIQIEREEKKTECLMKAIKEKQMEDQFNINKSRAESNIQEIAQQTKRAIAIKRMEIKKKILEMRKKQERKKKEMQRKLLTIRTVFIQQLNKAAKRGNIDNCFNPSEKNELIAIKYCEQYFPDDIDKLLECKQASNFCYICCENEFGDLYLQERDQCYIKCDKNPN